MTTTRSTHVGEPLTYAAIGASQAADLLYYPPKGYKPREDRMRLGSGHDRFLTASATLMAWGVQRGSGIAVTNIEVPQQTEGDYHGLNFDEDGQPVSPRTPETEQTYSEDGTPQISVGVTADLRLPIAGREVVAPVRVVLVISEPNRSGFVYGTLPGHPEEGEASFVVSHEPDDSVWLTVRSFSRPSSTLYRLGYPVVRFMQNRMTQRYLRALLPGRTQ